MKADVVSMGIPQIGLGKVREHSCLAKKEFPEIEVSPKLIEYQGRTFRVLKSSDQIGFKGDITYVKRKLNQLFSQYCLKKKSAVLDAFAGYGITTYDWLLSGGRVAAVEKNKNVHACLTENLKDFPADQLKVQHADNVKVMEQLQASGAKFDTIDLDPFGNAYQQFKLSLKLLDKGFIWLTSGEHINMRRNWNRDVLISRYGEEVVKCYEDKSTIPEFPKIIEKHMKSVRSDIQLVTHVMSHACARMLFAIGAAVPRSLKREFSKIPRYYGYLA
ncbi:MAG: RsmD family RNA methyltransferase [Candidatus Melainabacteria bacterium]|nr:RsmD family RNA methyltransferase [Candidatus Melainabacteria bacterium]